MSHHFGAGSKNGPPHSAFLRAPPVPLLGARKIQSSQKHRKFGRRKPDLARQPCGSIHLRRRPVKTTAFESFAANPESAPIPEKDLQTRASSVGKNKEMPRKGFLAESGAHQTGKTIKAFTHVSDTGYQKQPRGRTCGYHNAPELEPGEAVRLRTSIRETSSPATKPPRTSSATPPPNVIL